MMTQAQFIALMVGVPWRKWQASWEYCDCYGLVVMYYHHVLGIDLGDVPHLDLTTGLAIYTRWFQIRTPQRGDMVMFYQASTATHCGVYLGDDKVLHASGNEAMPGNVRINRLTAQTKLYNEVRHYAYATAR